MIIPRMGAASTTKTLLYATLIIASSMSITSPVHAIKITDITNSTTLFFDTFENQTTGAAPTTDNMIPGAPGSSLSTSRGGSGSTRNVVDTAIGATFPPDAPGPYEGSNYLLLDIPRDAFGYGASATASFTPLPAGNTLEISFAYAWGTGATTITSGEDTYTANGSGGPQLQLFAEGSVPDEFNRIFWMDSGNEDFHFYSSDGNTELGTISNAKGALGTWHTFSLTYTQGSSDLTVTVDGNETTLSGAVANSFLIPDHLMLNTTRAGVIAYDSIESAPGGIPGDFNGDTIVDGWDLIQWQNSYAIDGGADANGDGLSNGIDFLIWQRNFGTGAAVTAAATAVPEPGTIYLIALAVALFSANTRRTRTATAAHGKSV